MKRNEIKELSAKPVAELHQQLQTLESEVAKARLAKMAGKLSNLRQISFLRDDIARVKTALHQRQLEAK